MGMIWVWMELTWYCLVPHIHRHEASTVIVQGQKIEKSLDKSFRPMDNYGINENPIINPIQCLRSGLPRE